MRIELQLITRALAHQCAEVDMGVTVDAHAPNRSEVVMPDEWLNQVMALQCMSQEAINHLATVFADQGYVTLRQASEWLTIERMSAASNKSQVLISPLEGESIKACLLRLATSTECERT